jgi:very-short-patch-repair endonuclease
MSEAEKIRELLQQRPGLKAQQIATELGLERPQVAEALHKLAGSDAVQDNSYRWWPKSPAAAAAAEAPKSLLGRVCRYYLDCLARESGSAISLPAAAQDADYVPLAELPFAATSDAPALSRAAKRIIRKVRQERGQLTLYIGYPIRLRSAHLRDGDEWRIEPVLIYPVDEAQEESAAALRPAGGIPLFNLEALKSLLSVDSGNVTDEAIQLAEELGLANAEEDLPPWDEIILRLRLCRPEWDWQDDLNPYKLSPGPPLPQLTRPGIYNRAILFAGTRSPFTYGLELELRKLAQMEEDRLQESALGLWLRGGSIETAAVEDQPILELLPLNTEQRQAVVQGLTAPLTVVTGPPGTGKSQVVIALAANMAWRGRSVLFASKNNHAVDVVEARANELAPYPLLLRLGREEHHDRLAQHLTSALAESSNVDDAAAYAWLERAHEESRAAFDAVRREIARVVELRNAVDELERAAEPARTALGPERFAALRQDAPGGRNRLGALGAALEGAGNRERREWETKARAYWQAFNRLRAAHPLEQLARELTRIADESAHNSLELWRRWLRLWPSRWNRDQRKLLSEFVSLFQMIGTGDRHDQIAGKRVFRRYYSLFPEVTEMLPCWAVTSLSARGRLPFDPALFDLVIIDEASQCDIASALPLLLRARRAVIIGDPLQLKHVSTVVPQEDRLMLAVHGLAEGKAAWAYSVNSLFDLARTFCRHEDIVNLRDHHRSHRDIIAFSNRYFYRGALRVATDHDRLKHAPRSGPAVEWLDLKGRVMRPSRGGAVNPMEAQAVVAEIRKLVADEKYEGSIGVVTPFRAQANRIRTLAHQDPELSGRLAALHFVVDTVHGFQGDERDAIFFSPVVSQGTSESTLRFLKGHGNLFNVAITRARSELIVVGDRQAALDSGVSYLASFAEYVHGLCAGPDAAAPVRQAGPEYPEVSHPELVSEWERTFYRALYAAGLRPVPQYQEAPYTLDFALFAGSRKLDIEIDGEHYHRNWDGELCRRDQIRSRRLSDLGWEIMRFWVYELREDLGDCVARVRAWMGTCNPSEPL